jgi:hypothetical protein
MNPVCPVCQSTMRKVDYNYFKCNSSRVESHHATIYPNNEWILTLYRPNNQYMQIEFQPPNKYTVCFFNWSNIFQIPACTFQKSYTKLKHYLTLKTFL